MLKRWQLLLVPLLSLVHLTSAAGVVHAGASSAPVATAGQPTSATLVYTVKVNDTLWDIAVRHNTSVEALVAVNRVVNPKRLVAGQTLRIPPLGREAAVSAAPAQPEGAAYAVRAGDTMWDIATRHGIFVNDLIAANPGVDPQQLITGQTLVIPGASETGAPAASQPVGATYAVQADDTLSDIAANYGLHVNDLLAANPGVDPRRMMIGQPLVIPGITQQALDSVQAPPPAPAPATAPAADQAPTAAPAPVEAQGLSPELAAWAQDLLKRMNEKRVAGGRVALAWNNELALAAQLHAEDCAKHNRGSHVGSDGAKLRARLDRVGYAYQWAGENWANSRSAGQAFDMWWNEPPGADPHVQNIMADRATEIGIGIAYGGWGYYIITDFGSR